VSGTLTDVQKIFHTSLHFVTASEQKKLIWYARNNYKYMYTVLAKKKKKKKKTRTEVK
jgi:hypothetical protein